jgi:hypothetical protein
MPWPIKRRKQAPKVRHEPTFKHLTGLNMLVLNIFLWSDHNKPINPEAIHYDSILNRKPPHDPKDDNVRILVFHSGNHMQALAFEIGQGPWPWMDCSPENAPEHRLFFSH